MIELPHRSGTILMAMVGLTSADRTELRDAIKRRLGVRPGAAQLTEAYLNGAQRHALSRTIADGPVPTSLNVERSGLLLEVSRELQRVIEDYEIEALFRVSRSQARSMRTTLLATYSDAVDPMTMTWSLTEATRGKRTKGRRVAGETIGFDSGQKRDAFVACLERSGYEVEILHDDETRWQVIVGYQFPRAQLPKK